MEKIAIRNKKRFKWNDFALDFFVYSILIIITIVTFYPMWYVVVASFSTGTDLAANPGIMLWPRNITLGAYELVFKNKLLINSFKNTLIILIGSLPINIVMTAFCGYFMACKNVFFKKPAIAMIMFTMFFSGGMIPAYLNIKDLGLYDSLWALILPGALSIYNAIICKTAIEAIPESLFESANLDGANDFQIIFKIILPLIKPTLAVLVLYYGVSHWNSWFNASIYLKTNAKLPLQNVIRAVLLENSSLNDGGGNADRYNAYAESIKYAAIVITTVPILCIYPFLQKYFAKGVMIGAVKG